MKRIIFILLSLVFAGCQSLSKHPGILNNPICEPPCWENITPGLTTKEDAFSILSKIEFIDEPIHDNNLAIPGYDGELNFTLHKDSSQLGFLLILDDKVSTINFDFKMDLSLQEAIDLFGSPQNILVIRSGEIYAITLIDPQKGIAYGYFIRDRATEIKPQDRISNVTFFDPKTYQLLLNIEVFSWKQMTADETIKNLRPWEGFGRIDQYMTPMP